jgi:3-oxoacyl-[acyl-carrier-protein] synthase III
MAPKEDQDRLQRMVEQCFRREAGPHAAIPDAAQDLIATGALDSMGWVSFLRALESASGRNDLGALLAERTASLESIFEALRETRRESSSSSVESPQTTKVATAIAVYLASSSAAVGSRSLPSEEVDRAFGMPAGKLRLRAGIESLAYAAKNETELTLGARAAQEALHDSACAIQEIDWIIATSETHLAYPSLAAQLHSQLLARETCGALDVGGACLGLLNGFAAAQGLIVSGNARNILVVTSDVHSRLFTPQRVPGEFGGLFGDGASAFLLRAAEGVPPPNAFILGKFFFGCAGQYAGAIRVAQASGGNLTVHFDGEALSRAAITRLEKVILQAEIRSGFAISTALGLATHQPNPRLVRLLAKQLGVPQDMFPDVAQKFGNLGSSTCGVALHSVLQSAGNDQPERRGPIFLASLGPGLLFGGGWLVFARSTAD